MFMLLWIAVLPVPWWTGESSDTLTFTTVDHFNKMFLHLELGNMHSKLLSEWELI